METAAMMAMLAKAGLDGVLATTTQVILVVILIGVIVGYFVWKKRQE